MTTHAFRSLLALVVLFLGVVVPADAGGPLLLRAPGQPFRWPNGGVNIPFNPDQGGLGPLNNAQAVAQTTAAFAAWAAIPSRDGHARQRRRRWRSTSTRRTSCRSSMRPRPTA